MLAPLQSTDHPTDSPSVAAESCIQVDDLQFTLRRSARRRTMQITVERTGELVLSAPPEVDIERLRAFVNEKRFWIYTKLAEKDRLQRPVPRKEFVGGEGFVTFHAESRGGTSRSTHLVCDFFILWKLSLLISAKISLLMVI